MENFKIELSEREILTLREGLFLFKKYNPENLSDEEFNIIDDKIKKSFKYSRH